MADTEEAFRLTPTEDLNAFRASRDADMGRGGSSPDIASLTGAPDKSAIADLVRAQERKTSQDAAITSRADKQIDIDQHVMQQAFRAEGVSAGELEQLKPWDANKEQKKFEQDPIEGFGSLGGLFAVVASAFTKAPMENAILGMAGAINGLKEGNEAAYTRAHESWKENTKLALDRFKTQHELYSDALGLMDHDAAAANAKLHNAAVRFGDTQTLFLAEHGMVKELFELQASRASSAEQMQELQDKMTERTFQKAAIDSLKKNPPSTGDPTRDKMELAAQVHQIMVGGQGRTQTTAEQQAVGAYVNTHNPKDSDFVDGLAEIHQKFSPKAQNIEGYQNAKEQMETQKGSPLTPDEDAALLQKFGLTGRAGGGGTGTSSQAVKSKAIEQIIEEHRKSGKEIGIADAEREYNERRQTPTAHDKYMADAQYQKAERMETAMNEMDELLLKHKFITGIGGTLTRPVEALGNVLGSNETDRKQFQRVATELKEWGQSVVNDRTGRPLSSEAKDAAVIFAGLNPGDTGPNTIRAITELRPVIRTIKEQIKARGQGRGPVSGGGETPAVPAEQKRSDTPWLNDPVKP